MTKFQKQNPVLELCFKQFGSGVSNSLVSLVRPFEVSFVRFELRFVISQLAKKIVFMSVLGKVTNAEETQCTNVISPFRVK